METAPANTTSAAPAPGAPAAGNSSQHTAAAAASTPPAATVSTGAPGTSSAAKAPEASGKWTDGFDADTQEYVRGKGFQDAKMVLESYRNLEKLRGVPQERLLKLPEAGDDAGMKEVFQKLGTPPTPEGYGLTPKDAKQPGFTNWAKDTFHKLNLTAGQGQELVKQFDAYSSAQEAESKAAHTAKVQEQVGLLKKEWGGAFQQNLNRAQAAFRQFGIPDKAVDSLEQSIGFDGVMKLFHSLGTKIGEHSFVSGDGPQQFGEGAILTPVQAQAQIKALKQDPVFAKQYVDGDVKARQKMQRLHEMAHPD